MTYTNTSMLNLEVKDYSLWITLNRPDNSNAFTIEMIHELVETLYIADADSEIRSIVITGAGKNFCAGGDVNDMLNKVGMFAGEPNELRERYIRGIQRIPKCFSEIYTPVIAMINGAAIGAGLDLSCMCDIRIASEFAKFGETFAKLGFIPGDGGSFFLQRIIGFAKATELTLTGDIINAKEALSIGLVNFAVGANDIESKTQEILNKINSNPPIAIQMSKRAIWHAYRSDLNSHLDLLAAYQGITQRTSDHFLAIDRLKNNSSPDFSHK